MMTCRGTEIVWVDATYKRCRACEAADTHNAVQLSKLYPRDNGTSPAGTWSRRSALSIVGRRRW